MIALSANKFNLIIYPYDLLLLMLLRRVQHDYCGTIQYYILNESCPFVRRVQFVDSIYRSKSA